MRRAFPHAKCEKRQYFLVFIEYSEIYMPPFRNLQSRIDSICDIIDVLLRKSSASPAYFGRIVVLKLCAVRPLTAI